MYLCEILYIFQVTMYWQMIGLMSMYFWLWWTSHFFLKMFSRCWIRSPLFSLPGILWALLLGTKLASTILSYTLLSHPEFMIRTPEFIQRMLNFVWKYWVMVAVSLENYGLSLKMHLNCASEFDASIYLRLICKAIMIISCLKGGIFLSFSKEKWQGLWYICDVDP